jgi:hypothetical protein
MSPPTSGSNNKSNKKPESACYLLQAGFLLGLLFDPEEGGGMFIQNIG